ncbi:MAG: sigma-54-dependent Fis family transcriptional regulator [Deltaproteobacteria bacterium]|nr:sigma-54-dependent Fis family transcriptional regulator [Deltaproteobacteria bacterium]
MADKIGKILIVDDDEDVLKAARLFLKKHVEAIHTEKDPEKIPTLLMNDSYDAILLDMNFTRDVTSGQEGLHWLSRILAVDPAATVIMITAFGDINLAVTAVKQGATDFVLKPWQNEKLLATVSAAASLHKSRLEVASLRSRQEQLSADMDQPFNEFIGSSPSMQKVYYAILKVAKTDANVLILGENGTGKELVARSLHRHSLRSDEVFISVDMGAISESLFESELFGHVRGAFTDASADRAGRLEVASTGTLFLDEIANLSMQMQSKILSALETRHVTRLGSNKAVPIDIRLICATNMNISKMVKRNEFRQDLLYRINTVEIHLPPLREREDDLPLLAGHFLKIYCKKYNKPLKGMSPSTINKFMKYNWPGNVRELQHCIERAVILSDSDVLRPEDFFFSPVKSDEESVVFENYNLELVEKTVIRRAIDRHKGNISQAASELGLTRASLYRRMEKHGL